MSKRTIIYIWLACLAAAVVFAIVFRATKPASLRVGMTIRDPQQYFTQHHVHLPLHASTLVSEPNSGLYTYNTSFVVLGCEITSVTSVYRFDTNGTVLSIYTCRYWPIFHF